MAARRSIGGRLAWTLLLGIAALLLLAGAALAIPDVRGRVRAIVRPEPPPRITPLALAVPAAQPTSQPTAPPPIEPTATPIPPTRTPAAPASSEQASAEPTETPSPTATALPTPAATPTAGPVAHNGLLYDAYIPAASKEGQFFQYSCEFDAAWVVLETYGIDARADELVAAIPHDRSVEPFIEETAAGYVIHGGDIATAYSGDYRKNFLARSTAPAFQQLFAHYGLETALVSDRAGVEGALEAGQLVWMKTTVDFKPWRTATWVMPNGARHLTVLGNDHAVVAIGYSARGVVIRDVLGPTSTNRERPYEYEVDWDTFMAAWGAQSYDAVAVARPAR